MWSLCVGRGGVVNPHRCVYLVCLPIDVASCVVSHGLPKDGWQAIPWVGGIAVRGRLYGHIPSLV